MKLVYIDKDELYDYYIIQNHTRKQAAEHFNVSEAIIKRRCKDYNIIKDRNLINEKIGDGNEIKIDKDLFYKIYFVQNNTIDYCANFFNVSCAKIKSLINKLNCHKSFEQTLENMQKTSLYKYGCLNPNQSDLIKEKYKSTCIEKYGCENVSQKNLNKDYLCFIKDKDSFRKFIIDNNFHTTNEIYKKLGYKDNSVVCKLLNEYNSWDLIDEFESSKEKELKDFIKSIGFDYLHTKKIIYPYELDLYIPSKNVAIEYNGAYFHSIEQGKPKDYHLNKSLLCREKNIRLIHIYDFEDFENQKELLKSLLVDNIDNYNSLDFNKNNLIDTIPNPEIIYSNRVTVYGAGKLL